MNFKKTALSLLAASLLASAPAAMATNFKMALGDAAGGTQWELGQTFKTLFEQKTGGKHSVDLFPNGQLGSEQNTVNNASLGTLDFSVLAINNVTPFSPSVGVLTQDFGELGVSRSGANRRHRRSGQLGRGGAEVPPAPRCLGRCRSAAGPLRGRDCPPR